MADGSVRYKLQGGPHKGLTVRLYPNSDGTWDDLSWDGETYIHPAEQSAKKPYLTHSP